MNSETVVSKYRENYQLAVEEGHTEKASEIAWQWTEDYFNGEFQRIKGNHIAGIQESVNKQFFG